MKATGHPPYAETTVICACGSSVQIRSTAKNLHVNACSACHPFYTGKAALADAKGRVEQFRKRYQQAGK